ncbi:MAG: cytochrome P450 [Acidimicrobiia bacterium]
MVTTDVRALVRRTSDEEMALVEELMKVFGSHVVDFHDVLRDMRRDAPVHRGNIVEELGARSNLSLYEGEKFSFFRFDDIVAAFSDPATFSSAAMSVSQGAVYGRTLINMDPPDHRDPRILAQSVFGRRAMAQWRASFFAPLADAYVDSIADRGEADLITDLVTPYPVSILHGLFGLPGEEIDWFHKAAVKLLLTRSTTPEVGEQARVEVTARLTELIAERRSAIAAGTADENLITAFVRANDEQGVLDDEGVVSFMRLLLPAGAETTQKAAANLMAGLFTHPDQLALVRADPELIPAAVDESLRWENSNQVVSRGVVRDVVVRGVEIPAGSGVQLVTASAARDEEVFADPDAFDVVRKEKATVPFGHGIHLCVGMQMARIEMQEMLRALLERLPDVHLDPEHDPPVIRGVTFRTPDRVRVRWTPPARRQFGC